MEFLIASSLAPLLVSWLDALIESLSIRLLVGCLYVLGSCSVLSSMQLVSINFAVIIKFELIEFGKASKDG